MLSDKEIQEYRARLTPLASAEDHKREIGQKLKCARKKAKLTQENVAEILELEDRKTIQRYEKGECECPRETLVRMSLIYGCKVVDLLPEDMKPYFSRFYCMSSLTRNELQAVIGEMFQ